MDFDWKGVLANVAPALGTAIGGPFGALAGMAVKAVLGVKDDAPDADMQAAIAKATPEQLLLLKEADQKFQADMKKLDIDIMRLEVDNTKDARAREIATGDWLPKALAVLVTIGFFGLLTLTCFYVMPDKNAAVLNIMIGVLGAAWGSIINYYFGSSVGSAMKDKIAATREK